MPKRPQVSLRAKTHAKLKREAKRRGITIVELLEIILRAHGI